MRVNVGAGTERIHGMLIFEERKRGGSKEIKFAPKKKLDEIVCED